MKRKIGTTVLLVVMVLVGIATYPNVEVFSRQFWLWLTFLLGGTILVANILLMEPQYELFDQFTVQNFKNAPVFGMLSIPFAISIIAAVVMSIKEFILY